LNKLEKSIGRSIRNCSHAALDNTKKNCTVTLLVNQYASSPNIETIDMYSYRTALKKAVTVGNVTRALKEYAMDCSLNRDAIVVEGLEPLEILYDSQGDKRTGVNRNDTPLSSMCDWLDKCQYDCFSPSSDAPMQMVVPLESQDSSTYDEYTARYQLSTLRKYIQELFGEKGQSFITFETIHTHFNTIPRPLLSALMAEMVQQKEMKIRLDREGSVEDGRILYKNGFYVFQPDKIKDTRIPIAIRVATIPVARDHYEPRAIEVEKDVEDVAGLVGEELSKKISAGEEDSEALWEEVLEWADEIMKGTASDTDIPQNILTEVENLRESTGIKKTQEERLEVIVKIYKDIKNKVEERKRFSECVLDYFWDEFITHGTRRELLNIRVNDPVIKAVAKDMFWTLDGETYIRFLNFNNVIEYICIGEGGKTAPCSRAVAEVLSKEVDEDPILKKPLDNRYTGYSYGFILYNPKKMKFVFKKGKPPAPNGKMVRGAECAINSKIDYELKLLDKFGATLRAANMDDLGFVNDPPESHRIKNSTRICTACDLMLRYMDKAKVKGQRWFYRPLEAKLYGHPLR